MQIDEIKLEKKEEMFSAPVNYKIHTQIQFKEI